MDDSLKNKLEGIEKALKEIEAELSSADLVKDQKLYAEKAKKHRELLDITSLFNEWKNLDKDVSEAKSMMEEEIDSEMKKELENLILESETRIVELISEVKFSLLPKDPMDEKDVLVEIRPGAGGEEASIWVGDLFKMDTRYTERMGWVLETIEMTASDMGGYSKVIFAIKSFGFFNLLLAVIFPK